jgi:hypothetical protein
MVGTIEEASDVDDEQDDCVGACDLFVCDGKRGRRMVEEGFDRFSGNYYCPRAAMFVIEFRGRFKMLLHQEMKY